MSIRAVVLDIGGVLVVTRPLGVAEAWEDRLGLGRGEIAERLGGVFQAGAVGAVTEAEVHRFAGQRLGLAPAQVNAFMSDLWVEYLGTLNTQLAGYAASLRPAVRTGIISNSFVGAREREQERYHFDEYMDVIIYSHEVGITKPDRRIYELACERLDVRPAEMIFVDDLPENTEAARDLGIHPVLFTTTAQAIADVEACLRGHPRRLRGVAHTPSEANCDHTDHREDRFEWLETDPRQLGRFEGDKPRSCEEG
jgi:epoxide hydrolase-like predicted phosphatase